MPSILKQKGHKKLGGRQKGVTNKKTKEQRERVEFVLSLLDKTLESDLKKIPEVERIKLWASLQEFVRPKLARTELSGSLDVKATISDVTIFTLKAKGLAE